MPRDLTFVDESILAFHSFYELVDLNHYLKGLRSEIKWRSGISNLTKIEAAPAVTKRAISKSLPIHSVLIEEHQARLAKFILEIDDSNSDIPQILLNSIVFDEFADKFRTWLLVDEQRYFEGREPAKAQPLPTKAPALWVDYKKQHPHDPAYNPPRFIKETYGEWLGKGLTRASLGKLDPELATALTNWLRTNKLPPDFGLENAKRGRPVKSGEEETATWVERIQKAKAEGKMVELPPDPQILSRIVLALRRQGGRS